MARMVYIYCRKDSEGRRLESEPISCSNRRILSEKSGLGYENLVTVFTRKGRHYYETNECVVIRIYEKFILRGRQKIQVPGKKFGDSY